MNTEELYCQEYIIENPGVRFEDMKRRKCASLITGVILYDDGFMRPVCDRCTKHINKVLDMAAEQTGIPFFYE